MKEEIIRILIQYTYPKDQFGFIQVEDIADKILQAVGK